MFGSCFRILAVILVSDFYVWSSFLFILLFLFVCFCYGIIKSFQLYIEYDESKIWLSTGRWWNGIYVRHFFSSHKKKFPVRITVRIPSTFCLIHCLLDTFFSVHVINLAPTKPWQSPPLRHSMCDQLILMAVLGSFCFVVVDLYLGLV